MWTKRARELLAAFALGNGVLDLIARQQRALLWDFGPEGLRKIRLWYAQKPGFAYLIGIARIGFGIWLALRQYEEVPPRPWYRRWFSEYRLVAGGLTSVGFLVAILLTVFLYRRTRSEATRKQKGGVMPIARVTELSATSEEGFEDAINRGLKRATSTLRNVESAWIKDMNVLIENNEVAAYKVNMAITFVLEEDERPS